MESAKVDGFGKFLLACTVAFLLLLLALSCAPPPPPPGAICLTVQALDRQLSEAYANGYAKAKAEVVPRADVELNLITREQLLSFLKSDPCDRCLSNVYDAANSCLSRAECLLCSARAKGWDSYGVVINFEGADGGAHALVAFPLDDGTVVFVEPWYDTIEIVEVGKTYRPARKVIEEIGILK